MGSRCGSFSSILPAYFGSVPAATMRWTISWRSIQILVDLFSTNNYQCSLVFGQITSYKIRQNILWKHSWMHEWMLPQKSLSPLWQQQQLWLPLKDRPNLLEKRFRRPFQHQNHHTMAPGPAEQICTDEWWIPICSVPTHFCGKTSFN